MLLKPNSRYFVRLELTLRPARDRGAPLRLQSGTEELDALSVLQEALANGGAELKVGGNDIIRLTRIDVRETDGVAILLFRRSDPDASEPIFEHRRTRRLRTAEKSEEEAEALSAHLFVSLDQHDKPHPTYRAILEEVPGIGRSYVQGVLKEALSDVRYEYTDRKGKPAQTYTIPMLGGMPNETVGRAVRGGTGGGVKYVELERAPNLEGLDTEGLVPQPERMRISIKPTQQANLALVGRLVDWARGRQWNDVRLQVESNGRTRVVEVARESDAADVLFVKSEQVTTSNPISNCTDIVNEELATIATRMLENDSGW